MARTCDTFDYHAQFIQICVEIGIYIVDHDEQVSDLQDLTKLVRSRVTIFVLLIHQKSTSRLS